MKPATSDQFNDLCDYLAKRRNAIMRAWRKASDANSKQTTAHSLTRAQLNDHIPEVLDAFERKLRSRPGSAADRAADTHTKQKEVKHGLHRWQQGYSLEQLMPEWGHLHLCLSEELNFFATKHPEFEPEMLAEANRQIITLVNHAITESSAQYERMRAAEAEGRIGNLERALTSIKEIERHRATLIHEAVHDLHNDVVAVSVAAKVLGQSSIQKPDCSESATMLGKGIQGLTAMLDELMELARLEAGKERREITTFDATVLVTELYNLNQPLAAERGLYLRVTIPSGFSVEGDYVRARRLMQNLLGNALKYTEHGGVTFSCGQEKKNWWMMVEDTGSGMSAGPDTPITVGLKEATASAKEVDEKSASTQGGTSNVLSPATGNLAAGTCFDHKHGEGIGLSIVKRLCELLDASLEMASSPRKGTTFRVLFPKHLIEESG